MITREEIEKREFDILAPFAMKSVESRGRCHKEKEHPYRTVYQRDRDRIIHCTAFRRLEYKTQVFVNHEGDHFRTRLTHTMEVAQIARSMARALNLNEDLVEAVSLAHDLGHTPFGHSGEEALRELMKDHGGFEHNLHGLRVVDVLERRYPEFPGLNLSSEVRESIVKHVTTYDHPSADEFNRETRPLLESQVVEIADAIAYDSHDIDDSLYAGVLDENELRDLSMISPILERIETEFPDADSRMRRHLLVRSIIDLEVTDLIETTLNRIEEQGISSVEDVRRTPMNVVGFSPDMRARKDELEEFLFKNVYQHYRVSRMADKAKRFLRQLFHAYVGNPQQLPKRYQERSEKDGLHRAVCDYLAGMTDRYAQDDYIKLFIPYERI